MESNRSQSVTVNIGALSNALAVAIQQATTSFSASATAGPGVHSSASQPPPKYQVIIIHVRKVGGGRGWGVHS